MLLLVGGTTMASLNGAYPNYLAHLSNNESSTPTHHMRGAEQRNGNNVGSSALDVVALKKDNVNAQTLEQEGNKDQITFRTDKSVGEEIYLEISYPLGSNIESITVEGATLTKSEDLPNLLKSNRTYKLTSQEVRIIGEVRGLVCANNEITSLDLSKCPNLQILKCSNNLLESLRVDNNPNLNQLECNDNKIDYLDLSIAKKLQFLYCYNNLIENLIFSNDTHISTLECNNNKIKELDLSHATKLYSLDCSHNKITTLKTSLERITEIDCSFNEIKELNISAAYHLNRLNCDFNKLNKLSIDNCPLLSALFFKYNNISELSVQYNPKLIYVDAIESTTNMSLIEQLVASLPTVGDASNRQGDFRLISSLDTFNDFIKQYGKNVLKTLTKNLNNKGWKSADAHGTEIIASPYISFTTNKSVGETINVQLKMLPDANVEDIQLEGATLVSSTLKRDSERFSEYYFQTYKLTSNTVKISGDILELLCPNNELTSMDISNHELSILEFPDNHITTLDTKKACNLMRLDCSRNNLTTLDVFANWALSVLICTENNISTLALRDYGRLNYLFCSNNKLNELNLSDMYALRAVYCNDNQITKLTITDNPILRRIDCYGNNITEINIANNPNLMNLDIHKNKITLEQMEQLANDLPVESDPTNYERTLILKDTAGEENKYSNEIINKILSKSWKVKDATGTDIPNFSETPYISFTTNKSVGETINVQLKMLPGANVEDIQLEGATLVSSTLKRDSERFSEYYYQTYKLTSNTVKILGYVSDLLCPNNELTSIDISNPELLFLEFPDNHITTVDTKKAKTLIRLDCSRNNFTTLDVSTNKALRVLICTENNISTLNLPQDGKLNYLFCSNNKLNELNISNKVGVLRAVYCNDNQITKLTLTDHDALGRIDCYRNNITEINIANNPNLMNLDIHKNKITLEQMEQLANDLPVESDPSNYERILTLKDIVGEENKYSTEIINKILSKGWKVEDTNNVSLGISAVENDENQPRKVFDLNGREVNENQVKGVVIIKQGNKTYKKVVK